MNDLGKISDGFHTFDELYEHRHALFLALVRSHLSFSWKSKKHDDGTEFPGWFIVGMDLPTGTITYHIPTRLWGEFDEVKTLEFAPKWDGHTSYDVIQRLLDWRNDV